MEKVGYSESGGEKEGLQTVTANKRALLVVNPLRVRARPICSDAR